MFDLYALQSVIKQNSKYQYSNIFVLLQQQGGVMNQQPLKSKNHSSRQNRIQFNLSSQDLECFISKQPQTPNQKSKLKHKYNSQRKQVQQPLIRVISGYSSNKNKQSPYFDFSFDHKVLFTNYDQQQVYVDEQPNTDDSTIQNQHFNQDIQAESVVSQCVRAITEDTNDNSSIQFGSLNGYMYYKQQIIDINRNRNRFGPEDSLYCIRPGQSEYDGRTTLMLRNIPNKYTQEMVLQEVESAGLQSKYDFFYLPIDFKNDCNVGYAFINLVDVRYVQVLYEKFHGKKWPKFNSQKICQVCYARIQGTPQLLNHFRFSNTFQRDNRYRPLIYLNVNLPENKMRQPFSRMDRENNPQFNI